MRATWALLSVTCLLGCESGALSGARDAAVDATLDAALDAASPLDAATRDAATLDAATLDSAHPTDGSADAARSIDAAAARIVLARRAGCFRVVAPGDTEELRFGVVGTEYAEIAVRTDIVAGDWRRDLFPREPLNHNLFGLSRQAPTSVERYILGLGAQITPSAPGLARRAIFYGRVDLEPRPMGMGFMGYTSFRANFAWTMGARYTATATLDAAAGTQTLELVLGGATVLTIPGDIPYMSPALTASGWTLELGSSESDGRDVSPVGWELCDVEVSAVVAR